MIESVVWHMKNFRVEQNILVITLTANKMVMENICGQMERFIKGTGWRVKKVVMGSGWAWAPHTKVNGKMGMSKERVFINLKMVHLNFK